MPPPQLGADVHVVEREMAPHVAHVIAVHREQFADHLFGLSAVLAFEVAILDECHRRVVGPADVVAVGVDVVGEIEDVLARCVRSGGRARSPAGAGAPAERPM